MLRDSRAALGEKYAREIQAENELLRQAQGRITDRDSVIARLTGTEEELKKEAEALRKEKQSLLSLVRKKSSGAAHSAKVSEAERMLAEKESRLVKLRADLENTRAEKAELQGREKELREELKSRPYRAMLREAEEKLLIKEKMLSDMTSRMQRIGKDFEELKVRGQSAGAPGYLPDFEELVAGVAHQVANSISIIRSHAEFCTEAPDSEGARESLDVIVRNIVNLQKKIDIIMNFSRPVIPQRSPERLGAVLSEVLDSLRASGRLDNVKIKVKGGDRLKPVNLDRVRFEAALEQLLINAAEAMPAGGELNASVAGGPGKQRLEISDTGSGIEKKNLGSVFHPFFTTKPGKMGLGLTLARNVVRAHGGTLELHSEAGKGTRVVMELPEIS
jgi:signal transduction histidine kinase